MNNLLQDIRYAARQLMRSPGFTLVAMATLALGIGANTAIFTVVYAVLLRPLPFPDSERLVRMWESNQGRNNLSVSVPNYRDWQRQSSVFAEVGAFREDGFNFESDAQPERINGARVTYEFFHVMGVKPLAGRIFAKEEDQPGTNRFVVLGHGLWQRRFGLDPGVLGKQLLLDGQAHTVVGIMPRGFTYPQDDVELWTPYGLAMPPSRSASHFLRVVGRLKPGVALESARADLDTIARRLGEAYPQTNSNWSIYLVSMQESLVGSVRRGLMVLLGAVGFVLLIACANVATLLVARGNARAKEIAIRVSLGAGRARLLRQLLTESLLLSLAGGAAGLLVAASALEMLVALNPGNIPRVTEIALDGRVLLFTLGLSVFTGVIFGLAPALQASRADLHDVLKAGRTSAEHSDRRGLGKLLVVAETALAVVLLIGAGLMIRSFARLMQVEPGFQPENALTMEITLPPARYTNNEQRVNFWRQLLQRVGSQAGVQSASLVFRLPLRGNPGTGFTIEGRPAPPPGSYQRTNFRTISPDYFSTMGIPLIQGRTFTEQEAWKDAGVVVINQAMARKYWAGEDPLGKRISTGGQNFLTIVGVAGDIKDAGLDTEFQEGVYLPFIASPSANMTLIARTESEAGGVVAMVREQVLSLDRGQAVSSIGTLEQLVNRSVAQPRFNAMLFIIFGAVALALSMIGVYGVMAYSVSQRTQEFGLRLALGAQPRDIHRLVMGQGFKLALLGAILGVTGAFALTRLMAGLLFGIGATDLPTFASVTALLVGVAILASAVPSWRATRVDPMVALRSE